MKILITTDWYEPVVNGVVTSVVNLSKELRDRGHEVKILTLSRDHHTYIIGDVIYVASIGIGKIYPQARLKIPVVRKSIERLVEWKPDIIHSQCEFSTFFMAREIAKELDIPIVHTYHTVYEDYTHYFSPSIELGRKTVKKMTRLLSSRVSAMIAPSMKVKNVLEGYGVKCPVDIVPSGIDVSRFGKYAQTDAGRKIRNRYSICDDKTVLLFVGRIAKEKNIDELLLCQKETSAAGTVLMIVGDGPYRESIENRVDELGIRDSVIFTGMVDPDMLPEYYQAGDFFVSASTSETQGLTYMEALASGVPLLCRQDPCLDDVVEQGENGWTFTDERSFMHYIEKWRRMGKSEQNTMRESAMQTSEKFSLKTFADSVERIYTEICTEHIR